MRILTTLVLKRRQNTSLLLCCFLFVDDIDTCMVHFEKFIVAVGMWGIVIVGFVLLSLQKGNTNDTQHTDFGG